MCTNAIPGSWGGVDRRLEVMKALGAHVHLAIDLEHTRMPLWDLFPEM